MKKNKYVQEYIELASNRKDADEYTIDKFTNKLRSKFEGKSTTNLTFNNLWFGLDELVFKFQYRDICSVYVFIGDKRGIHASTPINTLMNLEIDNDDEHIEGEAMAFVARMLA